MPKAARLADIGAGHGCFPPTPIISGSGDVSINGRPAARKGDPLLLHACGNCPPHGRSISAGSATVSINGKAAARASDGIGCGGSVSTGSGDTLIGDVGMGGALKSCMEGASKSASAFVKVAFDAFPLSGEESKMARFTMATYSGPEALQNYAMGEAKSIIGSQLQSLQSAAYAPALASLGIDPVSAGMDAIQAVASGAPLQNAIISQVNNMIEGSLVSHLSSSAQSQLAKGMLGQAVSAIQGGRIAPDTFIEPLLSSAASSIPGAPLAIAVGKAAQSVITGTAPATAAKLLAPSLSPLTDEIANTAVDEFTGNIVPSLA
ncbi:PAAR domain-containing protein [Agarilytica rhodophyticola]|uniref:PAAR domain-containing protein n=1 Tax=Agarilytica rhodophyticola TaxID=1737490 RepID=UPI000B3449E9|nr:PAAR domain-containing protein [Agarilytica rhodophyticola]